MIFNAHSTAHVTTSERKRGDIRLDAERKSGDIPLDAERKRGDIPLDAVDMVKERRMAYTPGGNDFGNMNRHAMMNL